MAYIKNRLSPLYIMISYFIVACVFVFLIEPLYFISILIVLIPPAIFNYLLLKKSRLKILYFSLIATFLFAIPVELSMRLVDAWDVQSIFPRLFGFVPIENIIFAFINFFWALSFYEYFVDKDKDGKISKKIKYITALFVFLSLSVYLLFYFNRNILSLDYASFSVIGLLIPSIIIFAHRPKLLIKTIFPTLFFAFIFFVYEMVSMSIGSWWWPGTYLYTFTINGKIFPLDDVIIWYFLSTITLIGGYEFFVDDDK